MKSEIKKDKEKVFGFLKKYIFLSMVLILLGISIVFFSVYRSLEDKRIISNSNGSLLQISLSCDSLFEPIRKLTFQIYNDQSISNLVNNLIEDALTMQKAYARLNSFTLAGTNIISIYVYNRQTDCFYTTLSGEPKKARTDFFDKEAVRLIDDYENVRILYPIPRKVKIYGAPDVPNNTVNIYTIVYSYPSSAPAYPGEVIMINVSEEWVRNSIESWNSAMKGDICIMNEKGVLVSSLYKDDMLYDISQEEFSSRIRNYKNDTGSFICNMSDKKHFVTYVRSNKLGWYFIRLIPYSVIYENLRKISSIAALMFLVYLIIGFVISYIVTGKAKKSIDDIIDSLQNQIKDNRSDQEKLKEEFLYISLQNNLLFSSEKARKDFERYNISFSADDALLLILFRIDHYDELCSRFKNYEITLLKQAVMKEALKNFKTRYPVETVDMKDDHIVLVLNENACPGYIGEIDEMVRLVQNVVEKNIKLSVSAAISPSGYTFNDIGLLYSEVKRASNYRMFCGYKCIIHSEELKALDTQEYVYPIKKEKLLLDALMLGKAEQAEKFLDEILYPAKDYTYKVMNSLLLRLTSSIVNTFESIESTSKYSIDYDFNSFISAINKCETLDEIKNRFLNMFTHVFTLLEQHKNSKYEVLMNMAIEIINGHYTDENLCLNTIADKLNLSPNYLGRLFKTYTSKSIGDYINKIRVDKTLELLEEYSLPVGDIAVKAGFYSKSYFYTIFKKVMGITPSEYRQNIKRENMPDWEC